MGENGGPGEEAAKGEEQSRGWLRAIFQRTREASSRVYWLRDRRVESFIRSTRAAVVRLLELMNCFTNQQVEIEFATQGSQFAAFTTTQDGFADSDRAAESRDDAAHRRNLHLARGIANQENAASTDAAFDRRPTVVDRNACALVAEWREPALLHKPIQAAARFLAVFADQA